MKIILTLSSGWEEGTSTPNFVEASQSFGGRMWFSDGLYPPSYIRPAYREMLLIHYSPKRCSWLDCWEKGYLGSLEFHWALVYHDSFTGFFGFLWILGKLRGFSPCIIQLARLQGAWKSLGKVSLLSSMLDTLSCCATVSANSLLSMKEQHFPRGKAGAARMSHVCLGVQFPAFLLHKAWQATSHSLDSHSISQFIWSWRGALKRRAW